MRRYRDVDQRPQPPLNENRDERRKSTTRTQGQEAAKQQGFPAGTSECVVLGIRGRTRRCSLHTCVNSEPHLVRDRVTQTALLTWYCMTHPDPQMLFKEKTGVFKRATVKQNKAVVKFRKHSQQRQNTDSLLVSSSNDARLHCRYLQSQTLQTQMGLC